MYIIKLLQLFVISLIKQGLLNAINSIKKIYSKPSLYVQEPTRHYKETKNHIPPWILFKNITLLPVLFLLSLLLIIFILFQKSFL